MRPGLVALVDLACVLLFLAIGQRSHAEEITVTGVLSSAWPFVVALVIGWAVVRLWRRPRLLRSGLVVWLVTWAGGLALRVLATPDTAQPAFVLVSAISLAVLLLGWRALASLVLRRGGSRAGSSAARR